jgi:hypothetical protein
MSHNATNSVDQDDRLGQVLAEWLEAAEQGRTPDEGEFLRRYPEFAAELARCFADWMRFPRPCTESGRTGASPEPVPPAHGPLGDFRILREVGRGGMGIVYEAEQISLGRRVALKVLPFAATLDPRQLQRFHNEARAAAGLHHTNIVPVYGVGCDYGVHYYAMQFIDGRTLADFIAEQRGTIPTAGAAAASAPTVPAAAQATSVAPRDVAYFRRVRRRGARMWASYFCSNCRADLTWRLYRAPRLTGCPHCGVALNPGGVEKAVWAISFLCGFVGGLGGGVLGALGAMTAGTQALGLSPGTLAAPKMLAWASLGFGLTVWAAFFVWHDDRARWVLGRPGAPLRGLVIWLACAVIVPATVVALLGALYGALGVIEPALRDRGMNAATLSGLFIVGGVVLIAVAVLSLGAVHRRKQRSLARTRTTTATAVPEARGPSPARQTQPSRSEDRAAYLLKYLLSLCHNDAALSGRLIEHERGLHPHLPREELLELVIDNFRADNR